MAKPVILCVDDERVILESLRTQLKTAFGEQYLYETAESADEAMELIDELQDDSADVIVIVSDWLMPKVRGDEFLIRVHKKFPKVVKVMLTGQADEAAIQRAVDEANLHRCLYKPWHSDELVETIKSGLTPS
ncbi:response regulator [Candidatus Synechococcus calcipolaris G9]|uniref:Response regulator n=1 Tax=Candidatus Synechococcus calcipolaris G9 TaxID=1497997 RepID=A0ABT6F254_9SYNE|nr:response regulator [Candidatus Synechococcus calcipolaris]MDG2991913.1 response regulator [Candidatus Synechococcus calcipolaris G9]